MSEKERERDGQKESQSKVALLLAVFQITALVLLLREQQSVRESERER